MQHQFVPKPTNPQTQRWVIGDIHGCKKTFKQLIHTLALKPKDQLFLLGDYIDRGPDSAGVLDIILELMQTDVMLYALRGNHEQMVLDIYEKEGEEMLLNYLVRNKAKTLALLSGKLKTQYHLLLNSLHYVIESEGFVLVHAGINFEHPYPLQDFSSMLWLRETALHLAPEFNKTIIHGHTVTDFSTIQNSVQKKQAVICLDNGCVFKNRIAPYQEYGRLCALNLDTYQLIAQPNIDF